VATDRKSCVVFLGVAAICGLLTCACSEGYECRGPADCPGGMTCADNKCVPRDADHLDTAGGDACQDTAVKEIEPANDDLSSAPVLPVGRRVDGIIGSPGNIPDQDYFVFEAEAGQTMSFRAFPCPGQSPIDPILEVGDLASGGLLFDRVNDDDGESSASYLEVFFSQAGEYFLLVADYNNRFGGQAIGGDEFGYRLETHLISLPRRALPFESLEKEIMLFPGHLRVFSLRPMTTALLYASVTGMGLADPALTLVDAQSGLPLVFNDNRSDCPGSPDARVEACLNGPALLVVDGIGLGGREAELTLKIEVSKEQKTAGTTSGRLPFDGGGVVYQLPKLPGEVVSVSASSAVFSPALELLACTGGNSPASYALGRAGDPATAALERLGTGEGQLFARVTDRADLDHLCSPVGGSNRKFEVDINSRTLDPETPAGWEFDWTPPRQGALGAFSLSAPHDGRERLVVTARASAGSAAVPYLLLEQPSHSGVLTRSVMSSANPEKGAALTWLRANDQELQLLIGDRYGGGEAGFGMSVSIDSQPFEGQLTEEGSAANDDPSTAQVLVGQNLLVEASLDPAAGDRVDFFRIPVAIEQQLVARTWAADDSQVPDTILSVLSADGEVLVYNDDRGPDLLSAPPAYPARHNGEVLLKVELRGQLPRDYLLEVLLEQVPAGAAVHPLPGDLVVNEVLVDPGGFDVGGDGQADDGDQYVELVNASPYRLDLGGVMVWGSGGYLRLPLGASLATGNAVLLFNGFADPQLFEVEVFSGGSSLKWLGSGSRALLITNQNNAGYSPAALAEVFVPATAQPGESENRVVDGDQTRVLRQHSHVIGSIGLRSPGYKANGEVFR